MSAQQLPLPIPVAESESNLHLDGIGNENAGFNVPLLNQFNYPEWTPKMVTHLKSKGLYVWVSGDAAKQYNGNELKWEDRIKIAAYKESAFGEIQKHIDSSLHELFIELNDPQELWKFLQEHFQGQETFNQIELILLLVNCKLGEGKPIAEYISRKTQLNRRLNESGIAIQDKLFSAFLLSGLPKSLDICRRMLESRRDLDSSQIIRELHREEQRRKIESLTSDAVDEQNQSKRKYDEAFFSSSEQDRGCKGHPDACGKSNHTWEECFYNPRSAKFNKRKFVQREIQRDEREKNPHRKNANTESSQKAESKH
jgi:hypothetical protein